VRVKDSFLRGRKETGMKCKGKRNNSLKKELFPQFFRGIKKRRRGRGDIFKAGGRYWEVCHRGNRNGGEVCHKKKKKGEGDRV